MNQFWISFFSSMVGSFIGLLAHDYFKNRQRLKRDAQHLMEAQKKWQWHQSHVTKETVSKAFNALADK